MNVNLAVAGLQRSQQQFEQAGFACATRTHQGGELAWVDVQTDLFQNRLAAIAKRHIF